MKTIALAMLAALASCEGNKPLSVHATDNREVPVDLLFTHDGCKVYRFADTGYYRYFVRCEAGDASAEWQENCGKNCTRRLAVPTGNTRGAR